MEQVFLTILNMSITASWLILAVVLLRRMLQKAPKSICFFLWLFVGIRLICPIAIESTYSLVPEIQIQKETSHQEESKTKSFLLNTLQASEMKQLPTPINQTVITQSKKTLDITFVASIIWVIGIALMMIYSIVSYHRLHQKVRTAVHKEGRLWQCETVDSPFILGLFRPRIYLPFDMKESDFSHVIAHEQAHLRHLDHWIKPIAFLLLSFYWFNPVIWLAYVLLCRDIELACDERVIKEIGTDYKRSYSEALLNYSISRRSIAICPLAFGEVGVKKRIKSVLNYKKPRFWILLVAVLACIVVPICFLTNPKGVKLANSTTFGHSYQVKKINYSAPQYSFAYMLDTAPKYYLSKDFELMVKEQQKDWVSVGKVSEIQLTKENFDDYFYIISNIPDDDIQKSMKELREENQCAWTVCVPDDENGAFYYILQQKNGDIYVAYGYHPTETDLEMQRKDSIRWLFQLNEVGHSIMSVPEDVEEKVTMKEELVDVNPTVTPVEEPDTTAITVKINPHISIKEYKIYNDENESYFINDFYSMNEKVVTFGEEKLNRYVMIRKGTSQNSNDQIQTREVGDDVLFNLELAILQKYYSDDTKVIPYGGIVTLKTETVKNPENKKSQIIVYAMVAVEKFVQNPYDLIKQQEEYYGPVKVTFDVLDSKSYSLVEYWTPDEEKDYEQQIREQFPEDIVEDALDADQYYLTTIQDCIRKYACTGLIDIKKNIGNLLETIMSSPPNSSNVEDYIKAHNVSYSELLYYGETMIEYIFEQFLAGGETGLKGAILKEVLVDLLGKELKYVKSDATNGQEYFDAVLEYAKSQNKIRTTDYMEKRLPHLLKLVEMEAES